MPHLSFLPTKERGRETIHKSFHGRLSVLFPLLIGSEATHLWSPEVSGQDNPYQVPAWSWGYFVDASVSNCVVVGTLKGFDSLMNIVLDNAVEYLRGSALWTNIIYRCWRYVFAFGRVQTARNCDLPWNEYADCESGGRNGWNPEPLWIIIEVFHICRSVHF